MTPDRERCLERVLAPGRAAYDPVLLDCPAHKGRLLVHTRKAAAGMLIPVPSQDTATAALARTTATIAKVAAYHHLVILDYLLTMTTPHPAALTSAAALRATWPGLVFRALIPRRIRLTPDGRYPAPVGVYAPRSATARAYRAPAAAVLARVQAPQTQRRP